MASKFRNNLWHHSWLSGRALWHVVNLSHVMSESMLRSLIMGGAFSMSLLSTGG